MALDTLSLASESCAQVAQAYGVVVGRHHQPCRVTERGRMLNSSDGKRQDQQQDF
jgi:hypothetical protein